MSKKVKNNAQKYWQSLDQLADSPEYRKYLLQRYQEETDNSFSRRNFLSLMGASLALAGLASCRRPVEKIIPYVSQPEEIIPGVPNYYATSMPFGNSAYGLIVECHEGRPTKIEGNPVHPSTMGSSDILIQASILGLYDPDRSRSVKHNGSKKSYEDFVAFWIGLHEEFSKNRGEGLAVLSESFSSPTLARLKNDFAKKFPRAHWATYEPISDENIYKAIKQVTGEDLRPVYHYDKADVILSLDSDFLQTESENISAARGFAEKRNVTENGNAMNRLYVVESAYSVTGSVADHRMRLSSNRIYEFLYVLVDKLNIYPSFTAHKSLSDQFDMEWISAVVDDLKKAKGRCIVIAGRNQSQEVHELVFAINFLLGNIGNTVTLKEIQDTSLPNRHDIARLMTNLKNGNVKTLVIIGGNPAYNVPSEHEFKYWMDRLEHSVHFSEYYDETSTMTEWHVPRAHYLESWGDVRAADGTLGVIQPMIEPLFGGKSNVEFYNLISSGDERIGYDITRETWIKFLGTRNFEDKWRLILHDGLLENSFLPNRNPRLKRPYDSMIKEVPIDDGLAFTAEFNPKLTFHLELTFHPSKLYDGRYANNGWLMELPDPITKLAWDNAALISPATARELELKNGDIIEISHQNKKLDIPIWISPGQADYSISLPLGYGREFPGRVCKGIGFDTYKLMDSSNGFMLTGASIIRTGGRHDFANTQDHNSMEGRPVVREADLEEFKRNPSFAKEMVEHPPLKSIFPDHDYSRGYQWGMVIDLNVCIGCGACTIACQSENNIPIVGKEQVSRGREMHWIRNDRYYVGNSDDPQIVHQPVACQQCENAPCEQVCPVAATTHDKEGLNTMNYNRCIGTRYCSNNCPYKVRRFNFFNYVKDMPEVIRMAQNPDVTVRSRGVMEKCTFCIQRLTRAKRNAKAEGRTVKDGEVLTACQQACPANAIHFGNIIDPESNVSKLKTDERNHDLLGELNVRPRNSYLAKIRNPNPLLKGYKSDDV
ncbi:MAG: TAT-variant-translocated molybdopterin oxidoreductase [Candidatus Zixiibacteriota bacterium]|nr:MAG: TAT-variant-translocated molybdopterin oxidoreductase [candidate division Zixibacteria bacterium]